MPIVVMSALLIGCGSESKRQECASMTVKAEHDACVSELGEDSPSLRAAATEPEEEGSESSDQDDVEAEESGSSDSRFISFSMTNDEGWEYEGEIPLPEQEIELGKEIAASPPGEAQITTRVVQTPVQTQVFHDINPGRPGGPELRVEPGYFAYPIPTAVEESFGGPYEFGPCEGEGYEGYGPEYEPFRSEIRCQVSEESSEDQGISEQSGAEDQIDAMSRAMNDQQGVYVLNFSQYSSRACNIFVDPDGRVRKSKSFEGCEELHLKVSR